MRSRKLLFLFIKNPLFFTKILSLFRMMNKVINGEYKMDIKKIFTLFFVFVYIIFPIDLILDFIPVIGWIDDITVLAFGLNVLFKEIDRFLDWEKLNKEKTIA